MNTYPTKPTPAIGSARAIIKPALRSQSESGYIYTRAKFTRQKSKYTLNYPLLTKSELETLVNFFNENQGQSFKFTHPLEKRTENLCLCY